jgi:hypothetical protein
MLLQPYEVELLTFGKGNGNSNWVGAIKNLKVKKLILNSNSINPFKAGAEFFTKMGVESVEVGGDFKVSRLLSSSTSPVINLDEVVFSGDSLNIIAEQTKVKTPLFSIFNTKTFKLTGTSNDEYRTDGFGKNPVTIFADKSFIDLSNMEFRYGLNDELDMSSLVFKGGVSIDGMLNKVFISGLPTSKTQNVAVAGDVKLTDDAKKVLQNLAPGVKTDESRRFNTNTRLNEAKSCKGKVSKFLKDNGCEVDYEAGTCKMDGKSIKIEKALLKLKAPETLIKSYTAECEKEVNEALRLMRRR